MVTSAWHCQKKADALMLRAALIIQGQFRARQGRKAWEAMGGGHRAWGPPLEATWPPHALHHAAPLQELYMRQCVRKLQAVARGLVQRKRLLLEKVQGDQLYSSSLHYLCLSPSSTPELPLARSQW